MLEVFIEMMTRNMTNHWLQVAPSLAGDGVQKGAVSLVEAALNPRNLCRMDPTWHPWF